MLEEPIICADLFLCAYFITMPLNVYKNVAFHFVSIFLNSKTKPVKVI